MTSPGVKGVDSAKNCGVAEAAGSATSVEAIDTFGVAVLMDESRGHEVSAPRYGQAFMIVDDSTKLIDRRQVGIRSI